MYGFFFIYIELLECFIIIISASIIFNICSHVDVVIMLSIRIHLNRRKTKESPSTDEAIILVFSASLIASSGLYIFRFVALFSDLYGPHQHRY